jgi:hypothetical protein
MRSVGDGNIIQVVYHMGTSNSDTNQSLKRDLESFVLEWPGVTQRETYGYPSYSVDGSLFAALSPQGVVLTALPPAETASLRDEFETPPFRVDGRVLASWTHVPIDDSSELNDLHTYLAASYETARELK